MTVPRRPRLLLYYPPGFDMQTWRAAFDEGRRAEASHWSMHLAEAHGFEVRSTADSPHPWLGRLVTRLTFRILRIHLHHLWANRRAVRDADIIWAMSERELLAALLAHLAPCSRQAGRPGRGGPRARRRGAGRNPVVATFTGGAARWMRRRARAISTGQTLLQFFALPTGLRPP